MRQFKLEGKLAPHFIGPFRILSRRGEVAYQLELPPQLSVRITSIVPEKQLPLEDLDIMEDLSYTEYPIKILETSERVTRNRRTRMCKVQWNHHSEDEATWEREDSLKAEFPYPFDITSDDEV